jgi:hypothetical protein
MNCLKHQWSQSRSRNGENGSSFEIKAIGTEQNLSYHLSWLPKIVSCHIPKITTVDGECTRDISVQMKIQVNTEYYHKNLVFVGKSPGL